MILRRYYRSGNPTNLYLVDGLAPGSARFAAIVDVDSDLADEIDFVDSWSEGCRYAFFVPPSSGQAEDHSYLSIGTELLRAFTGSRRFVWFHSPSAQAVKASVDVNGNDQLPATTDLSFRNFKARLPTDTLVRLSSGGFEFVTNGTPCKLFRGTQAVPATTSVVRLPLTQLDDLNQLQAWSSIEFELAFRTHTVGLRNDFERLHVGLCFFTPSGATLRSTRFAVFRPLAESDIPFSLELDLLVPTNAARSRIKFGSDVLGSFYKTALGEYLALQARHDCHLTFADRYGRVTAGSDTDPHYYLVPSGKFEIVRTYQSDDQELTDGSDYARRLACGNSGTEYIYFNVGDVIHFETNKPAFYDTENLDRQSDDPLLDDLEGDATTAWVHVYSSQELEGQTPDYRAQPDDAPLYTADLNDLDGYVGVAHEDLLDFQQRSLCILEDSHCFPLAPADGFFPLIRRDSSESARDLYVTLETMALAPTRRRILGESDAWRRRRRSRRRDEQDTVTPQGLKASLSDALEWNTVKLARTDNTGSADLTEEYLEFQEVDSDSDLVGALERAKTFVVMSEPPTARFSSQVGIRGWRFNLELGETHDNQWRLLIIKYYDRSIEDLAKDRSLWAPGKFFGGEGANSEQVRERIQHYLIEYIEQAVLKSQNADDAAYYSGIASKLVDRNWNGILAINVKMPLEGFPAGAKCISAGLSRRAFDAHHFGVNASRVRRDDTSLTVERSSMFALVDYKNPEVSNPNLGKDFFYEVDQLRILFENSSVLRFDCELTLTINKLFKQSAPSNNEIVLVGSYETRDEGDRYTFVTKTTATLTFSNAFITRIVLRKVQLATLDLPASNEVTCRFTLTGELVLGNALNQWLCFESLNFDGLGLQIYFILEDGAYEYPDQDPTFLPGVMRFDVSKSKGCPLALISRFPLDLKSFVFAPDDQITLRQLGYFPVRSSPDALFDYGLVFELDLGSLGALASAVRGLRAEVLLGWIASSPNQPLFGIRLPEGRLELGIQGVLRLVIGRFDVEAFSVQVDGNWTDQFVIILQDCRIEIFGLRIPRSGDDLSIRLFPNPSNPADSKIGWFGSESRPRDPQDHVIEEYEYFVGLGQRVRVDPTAVRSFEEAFKEIAEIPTDSPPLALRYSEENKWLAALAWRVFSGVHIGAVFNDPSLYGMRISVDDFLTLDVLYRKINRELGVYSTEITLPPGLRTFESGAMSFTAPVIGLEIFTNGNFILDVGFPRGFDFDRSCKLQVLPFIGAGGFYVGRLSGKTSRLLPGNFLSVAAFGIGLKVGIGKEYENGILRIGASISVYGILEGALGFNSSDLSNPEAFVLTGRVGIVAELFGHVDFGIVLATVEIVLEVGMPFRIEQASEGQPKFSSPGVEANVHVTAEVVIGREKIFGEVFEIKVSYSYQQRIRLSCPIGEENFAGRYFALAFEKPAYDDPAFPLLSMTRSPLTVYFVPRATVTGNEKSVQALVLLGMEYGEAQLPTKDFDRFAQSVYAFALREHGFEPTSVITQEDLLDLDFSFHSVKSFARLSAAPLTYATIIDLIRAEFDKVIVEGLPPEDASPIESLTLFPIIPDLTLEASRANLDRQFSDHEPRNSDYQDALEAIFDNMYARLDDEFISDREDDTRDEIAFATLAFEQYVQFLIIAANELYLQRFEDSGEISMTVAELLSLELEDGTSQQINAPFEYLASRATNLFYGGLRLIYKEDDQTLTAFYELTGQQVLMVPKPTDADPRFPLELKIDNPLDWLEIGSAQPKVEEILMDGFDSLEAAPFPSPPNVQSASPMMPTIKQYNFTEGMLWAANASNKILWPLGDNLVEEFRWQCAGVTGTPAPPDAIRLPLFLGDAKERPRGVSDLPIEIVQANWATYLELSLRRVADVASSAPLAYMYELGGISEANRVLLDSLLAESPQFSDIEIAFAYRSPTDDSLVVSPPPSDECGVTIIKTNLSTESRPPRGFTASSELFSAALDDPGSFLELVWQCSIVNSGGYYLRYRTSVGGDPFAQLFNNTEAARIWLVIIYGDVPRSSGMRHYHNAVVTGETISDPDTGEDLPLLPIENGNGDYLPYVFARMLRQTLADPTRYEPLIKYQSSLPPGVVRFTAERTPLTGTDATSVVGNLYSMLSYSTEPSAPGRQIGLSLPITPRTNDSGDWVYTQAVPVFEPDGDRYVGVGSNLPLRFAWRDIYGNEAPNSGSAWVKPLAIKYVDELISPKEWPGLSITLVAHESTGSTDAQVCLRLSFERGELDSDPPSIGKAFKEVYLRVEQQLTDDAAQAFIRSTLRPAYLAPCTDDLLHLVEGILGYLDGDLSSTTEIEFDLELDSDDLADHDFFEIQTEIIIARDPSDRRYYWEVSYPWEPQPDPHEDPLIERSHKEVIASVPVDVENAPSLDLLEEVLTEIFERRIHLAIGRGLASDKAAWVVNGERVQVRFRNAEAPYYFAARPVLNELVSGEVEVGAAAVKTRYTDIDLDVSLRRFLDAVEQYLTPANQNGCICLLDEGGTESLGLEAFNEVMDAKRVLADELPSQLLADLFSDSAPGSRIDKAREEYRQKVRHELSAFYGTDIALQFEAESNLQSVFDMGGEVNLFGTIWSPRQTIGENALSFGETKISFVYGDQGLEPADLNVLVDAVEVAAASRYLRQIEFRLTAIEFDVSRVGEYRPSSWLTLVHPISMPIRPGVETTEIPVPLRQHPLAPRAIRQVGIEAPEGIGDEIQKACYWKLVSTFQVEDVAQDSATAVVAWNAKKPVRAFSTDLLFAALMKFEHAFPEPKSQFAVLRGGTDDEKRRVIREFLTSVDEVVTAIISYAGLDQDEDAGEVETFEGPSKPVKGSVTSATTNTITDASASFDSSLIGNTILIEEGVGSEQARQIHNLVSPTTLEISQPWSTVPNSTSRYAIPGSWPSSGGGAAAIAAYRQGRPGWSEIELTLPAKNILEYECALTGIRVVRNRDLLPRRVTNEAFIYHTSTVWFPFAVTPRIDKPESIDLHQGSGQPSLQEHLEAVFRRLFVGISGERRLSIQFRNGLSCVARVERPDGRVDPVIVGRLYTPVVMLPPLSMAVDEPSSRLREIATCIESWHGAFLPTSDSDLVLDFTVFSSLSTEPDLPVIRLRELRLSQSDVSWPH
jgi:hypothetical protein